MPSDKHAPVGAIRLAVSICVYGVFLPAVAADRAVLAAEAQSETRPSACDREAVLLANNLELRPAPDRAVAVTMVLMPGASIYRCERRGAFLGVMFPEEGGSVDCSMRPPGLECPTGWTDAQVSFKITG